MNIKNDNFTILFIDDDKLIRDVYSARAYELGINLITLTGREDLIQKIIEITPDLISLDTTILDFDYIKLIKEIKANPIISRIPIFILSNRFSVQDVNIAFDCGAVDYFIPADILPTDVLNKYIKYLKDYRSYDRSDLYNNYIKTKTGIDDGGKVKTYIKYIRIIFYLVLLVAMCMLFAQIIIVAAPLLVILIPLLILDRLYNNKDSKREMIYNRIIKQVKILFDFFREKIE